VSDASGTTVQYPDVTVRLVGEDGNALHIIGTVSQALRRAHGHGAANTFMDAALDSGSYDELLALVQRTVVVR